MYTFSNNKTDKSLINIPLICNQRNKIDLIHIMTSYRNNCKEAHNLTCKHRMGITFNQEMRKKMGIQTFKAATTKGKIIKVSNLGPTHN